MVSHTSRTATATKPMSAPRKSEKPPAPTHVLSVSASTPSDTTPARMTKRGTFTSAALSHFFTPAASAGISTTCRPLIQLRSEEHTSELQSQSNLVCRLLLEKKKQ